MMNINRYNILIILAACSLTHAANMFGDSSKTIQKINEISKILLDYRHDNVSKECEKCLRDCSKDYDSCKLEDVLQLSDSQSTEQLDCDQKLLLCITTCRDCQKTEEEITEEAEQAERKFQETLPDQQTDDETQSKEAHAAEQEFSEAAKLADILQQKKEAERLKAQQEQVGLEEEAFEVE